MPDDREPLSSILKWDSDFFGFKVAKINKPNLSDYELGMILNELTIKKVKLVYWPADLSVESQQAAIKHKGIYVDRKITYVIKTAEDENRYRGCWDVGESSDDWQKIFVDLAKQSSIHSRFRVDPFLPNEKCDEMYKVWVEQSLNGSMGNGILMYDDGDDNIMGIVTVGEKNGRGDIGLVAVDEEARGKGVGTTLIKSALKGFYCEGYKEVQVVTQGNNIGARKLYEKCGFKVDTIEEFYHFWL